MQPFHSRYRSPLRAWACLASLFLIPVTPDAAIGGTVVDAASGAPVAGASVRHAGSASGATTDAQGRFQLPSLSLRRPLPGALSRPDQAAAFDAAGRALPNLRLAWLPAYLRPGAAVAAQAPLARSAAAPCLLAVEAAGYKPREANCVEGDANAVKLVSEAAVKFYWEKPVDAGDGLVPGALEGAVPAPKAILDLMDSLAAKRYKEVHSLLILRGGKLLVEEYYRGNNDTIDFEKGIKRVAVGNIHWTRTGKHYLASVTKSYTSLLTGMALAKAGKTQAATLASLLPEFQARFTGGKEAITVEHVLTMTAGLQWDEWAGRDLADMWASADIGAYALAKPMAATPGTQWVYNSAGPNLLLTGLKSIVGMDMGRFARENLYGPLGIEDFRWANQPNGQPEGSARVFMRPRDMAKIGLMVLQGGRWQGAQVVPADWIAQSTKFHRSARPRNPYDYAYLWWVRQAVTPKGTKVDYFQADGDGGQYIVVLPAQDMVVVSTGGNYGDWNTYDGQMGRLLARHVLPAVGL